MAKGNFVLGDSTKEHLKEYTDHELKFVNKGFVLEFFHVPSGKIVQFKAMLTDFKDNFESNWNQEPVYGRNDPIQNFQGTKRTISIAWDLVAASWGEAKDNLQRATLLNSMLYPSYSDNSGNVSTISAAPIFKLSFANLIKNYGNTGQGGKKQNVKNKKQKAAVSEKSSFVDSRGGTGTSKISGLVGSIAGFSFAPVIDNGFFDPAEEPGKLFPQTISLSCEFTVMHTHKLGWNRKDFRNSNFPYGMEVQTIEGPDSKEVMEESKKGSGTGQHNAAQEKKILGG